MNNNRRAGFKENIEDREGNMNTNTLCHHNLFTKKQSFVIQQIFNKHHRISITMKIK